MQSIQLLVRVSCERLHACTHTVLTRHLTLTAAYCIEYRGWSYPNASCLMVRSNIILISVNKISLIRWRFVCATNTSTRQMLILWAPQNFDSHLTLCMVHWYYGILRGYADGWLLVEPLFLTRRTPVDTDVFHIILVDSMQAVKPSTVTRRADTSAILHAKWRLTLIAKFDFDSGEKRTMPDHSRQNATKYINPKFETMMLVLNLSEWCQIWCISYSCKPEWRLKVTRRPNPRGEKRKSQTKKQIKRCQNIQKNKVRKTRSMCAAIPSGRLDATRRRVLEELSMTHESMGSIHKSRTKKCEKSFSFVCFTFKRCWCPVSLRPRCHTCHTAPCTKVWKQYTVIAPNSGHHCAHPSRCHRAAVQLLGNLHNWWGEALALYLSNVIAKPEHNSFFRTMPKLTTMLASILVLSSLYADIQRWFA